MIHTPQASGIETAVHVAISNAVLLNGKTSDAAIESVTLDPDDWILKHVAYGAAP